MIRVSHHRSLNGLETIARLGTSAGTFIQTVWWQSAHTSCSLHFKNLATTNRTTTLYWRLWQYSIIFRKHKRDSHLPRNIIQNKQRNKIQKHLTNAPKSRRHENVNVVEAREGDIIFLGREVDVTLGRNGNTGDPVAVNASRHHEPHERVVVDDDFPQPPRDRYDEADIRSRRHR